VTGLRVLAVLAIVAGNAFFVAAEYALVTAKRVRLQELAEEGNRRARIAVRLIDDPFRFISTTQLGVTVFSILLGAVGEPIFANFFDPLIATTLAYVIGFALVTWLHVTLGELVPKTVALWRKEGIALWVALPLEAVYLAAYPLVSVLQWSATAFTRPFGIHPAAAGVVAADEHEIRMLIDQAEESDVIEQAEEEMLYKVFDFADKEAHDVMVPRPEVVALSADLPPQEALAALITSPYTRYPVYRTSLDEIIGVLHVRDLFSALYENGIENVRVEELIRPAYVVPEHIDLGALLAEFRKANQHLAIVVDEYGAMQGIVTLEDLLEEIVGEIEDEYDLPDESVQRLDDTRIRIDGTFPVDDFNEQFDQELPLEAGE
jgi:putative hemolysin